MDTLIQDLRFALRQLRRRPGFAAVAVLTLALGIGATTAIFSVAHSVLFRPLPLPQPDRLVMVWESNPEPGWNERNVVSSGNFMDWRDQATVFEGMAAFSWRYGVGLIGGDGEPERVMARRGSPDLFRVLGVSPALGHGFGSTGESAVSGPRAILSHGLWTRRFGADPGIVGRTVTVNENPVTVIGVMPQEFRVPVVEADLWFPVVFDEEDRQSRKSHQWQVVGRLSDGTTLEQARSEMQAIAERQRERFPQFMAGFDTRVIPFRADMVGQASDLVLILLGVVVVVLLIACSNVANLLLARTAAREREVAVRGALGASRGRLARQLLTEGAVLALLGGAAGVTLAAGGTDLLVALAPSDIPLIEQARIDGTVLAFAAGASLLSTLLFALAPALRASRSDPQESLRTAPDRAGGGRDSALGRAVLVAEVALSVLLLAGAGLLVRSFVQLQEVDPGFQAENLLAVSLDLPRSRYSGTEDHVSFYRSVIGRIEEIPGVVSAAGTPEPPIIGFNNTFSFVVEGRPRPGPDPREDPVEVRAVTPGYLRNLGIPLVAGRGIEERDRADAPRVAVMNQSLARKYWPDGDAVGKRINFDEDRSGPWWTVVGVAADTRDAGLEEPPSPALYIAHAQKRWSWMSWMTLLVRTAGAPGSVSGAVEAAVHEQDDHLPIHRLAPVTELFAESQARRRFATGLLGGFAALALLLGAVGIYGVISYSVARRRREIGIRMSLGAARRRIARHVVGDALRVAGVGAGLGLLGALILTRFLEGLLYAVPPRDPVTLAAAAAVIGVVAVVASWLPARRAMGLEPVEVLRAE